MTDPVIGLVIFVILIAIAVTWLALSNDIAKQKEIEARAMKQEVTDRYHFELDRKYHATMTDEDRRWYYNLPDWDRIPLRENGEKR